MVEKTNARRAKLKEECKRKDISQLQEMLREKRIELSKRRIKQLAGGKMKAYSAEDKGKPTIKELRRDVAVIQTFINQGINKVALPQKK